MEEMKANGIPASIKLAQALLESDNGNSLLAREANNHFGIKCHTGWKGPVYHKDDDANDECFRSYVKAEESFRDHSRFLRERERYRALFGLNPDDYEGWAHGLKQAGYATNPQYAHLLIKIIRDNRLDQFDKMVMEGGDVNLSFDRTLKSRKGKREKEEDFGAISVGGREVFLNNGVEYVLAATGDSYEHLAKEFALAVWMIRRFNEVDKNRRPKEGERVYLQPKKRKHTQDSHMASGKETLWDISMTYAVRAKKLKKWNECNFQQVLPEGTRVYLHKRP